MCISPEIMMIFLTYRDFGAVSEKYIDINKAGPPPIKEIPLLNILYDTNYFY
jgi:hypothetical protein